MTALEELYARWPNACRDIKLNLQSVFQITSLTRQQIWGVTLASAVASRNAQLRDAVWNDALREVDAAVCEDAIAAASIMAMNNVFYRFRHYVQKPSYSEKPARLRMNRLINPATNKLDFELYCLVVSAINGCETCICAHEKTVLENGLNEDQVHDAIRIGSILHAAAVALECINKEKEV